MKRRNGQVNTGGGLRTAGGVAAYILSYAAVLLFIGLYAFHEGLPLPTFVLGLSAGAVGIALTRRFCSPRTGLWIETVASGLGLLLGIAWFLRGHSEASIGLVFTTGLIFVSCVRVHLRARTS